LVSEKIVSADLEMINFPENMAMADTMIWDSTTKEGVPRKRLVE
jgi:hypothetical protein